VLNESDFLDIQADIHGPVGTPYHGGVFRCKLVLSSEFPKVPPKGYFLTKIFHPNVSEKGEICVNTLKKDWDPSNWSLQHVLEIVRCLLIVPFPESALNEEAGKAFMEDYEEYAQHARLITELYALPKVKANSEPITSPTEIPVKMEISFENTREDSPKKIFSPVMTSSTLSSDSQLLKLGNLESPFSSGFKVERPEEVLMTVTNSYNPNHLNTFEDVMFKKVNSLPPGFVAAGNGQAVSTPTSAGIGGASFSAKKENDDKKKWKKRI
jgi:ubiquitin-conjugating enzyme E2 S